MKLTLPLNKMFFLSLPQGVCGIQMELPIRVKDCDRSSQVPIISCAGKSWGERKTKAITERLRVMEEKAERAMNSKI